MTAKLTLRERDMHALFAALPKMLPTQLPGLGEIVAEAHGEPGVVVRILKALDADRYAMVCDVTKEGVETRRLITPVLARDQILGVAEGVMLGWQSIATWPHATNVLAMGVAIGLMPEPEPEAAYKASKVATV